MDVKTRVLWPIKPVQKPHSTFKGKKGYNRARDKRLDTEPEIWYNESEGRAFDSY